MTLKEKILYHQLHPGKLVADIGCEPVSLYFLWQHNLAVGLLTHFLPPIVGSLLVIRFCNLAPYRDSRSGQCMRQRMTTQIELIRLAGDTIAAFGAWFHSPLAIAAGLTVVVLAWWSVLAERSSLR